MGDHVIPAEVRAAGLAASRAAYRQRTGATDPSPGGYPDVYADAAVNAVWPLAVAEGRRQALDAIGAEAHERRRLAKDALDRHNDGDPEAERHKLRFLAQAVVLEQVAERLREATDG